MSYAEQLTLLVLTGLITLTCKIVFAVAKEKRDAHNAIRNHLTVERVANNSNSKNGNAWPSPNTSKADKAGKVLTLLFVAWSLVSFGNVQANFNPDKYAGCPPLLINFTNLSNNAVSVLWDFGNGNTSSLRNPSATFLTSGVYQVKLVVKNGLQSDSVIKTIRVFELPIVNFTANKTSACLTDTIHFLSQVTPGDGPITHYAWGFGNGMASSDSSASYRYNQTGNYNITLVVLDSNGCSANKTITAYVKIFSSPVAAFTASPQNSCNASQLVTFTNQSTGNGLRYLWNLDDSVTSALVAPSHTYYQEKRQVKLTVTDSIGCSGYVSKIISAEDITANFKASKTRACTDDQINFTNLSNFSGSSWFWNFGDGTTSTSSNPVKAYTSPGIYTVAFKVKDGACGDSIIKHAYITIISGFTTGSPTFSADTTVSCGDALHVNFTNTTPGGSSYLWNFGNGDTSNLQNPSAVFAGAGNYTITLTVRDSNGCVIKGSIVNFIQTARPVARFTSDTVTCTGGMIHFINHSTNASSFHWNFGDGDTSSISSPSHTYSHGGTYNVQLTAYSSAGCDSTIIKMQCVHVDSVHVDFNVSSAFSPCPPFVCVMHNESASNIVKFAWDFGDGYKDTAANPIHIYFYPGVYSVKLIGYTVQGCSDTMLRQNLIVVQGPTGNFNVNPKTGCTPLNVTFSATVSSNTQSAWCDLGNGTVLPDSLNFIFTYTTPKVYHPQFILTDHVGCTVSYPLDSIITYASPVLHIRDTSICAGTALNISLAPDSNHYQWTPALYLQCDTCGSVTINASDSVSYSVTETNEFGCQSTAAFNVNVVALPVLDDSVSVRLCKNDTCRLFAGNAAQIIWSPAKYLSDSTSANPVCAPLTSTIYAVHAYNSLGCASITNVSVTVIDKLDILMLDSAVICAGGSIQFDPKFNVSTTGIQYSWSPAQYLDNANIATPTATLNDSAVQFQLIVSNGRCIADTQTITVYTDVPEMHVPTGVTTTPLAEVSLSASSNETLSYTWYAKDNLNCNDCSTTSINPTTSQTVFVEGKSMLGCVVKDSIPLVVSEANASTIFIPNAFTPNGDGTNDVFEIYGNLQAIDFLEIQIFNRWGQIVFESNNHHFKWDGTYKGRVQDPGVFTYQIQMTFNDGQPQKVRSGCINLLR